MSIRHSWYSILSIVFALTSLPLAGQRADSLFATAQREAYAKNYRTAETLCRQAIREAPANTDYQVFLGRIFAWHGKTDSSRAVLSAVITREPSNTEAFDALTDAELWSGHYNEVIRYCTTALTFAADPQKDAFLLKKAKAYHLLGDDDNARPILEDLVRRNPANTDAKALLDEILSNSYKNAVSVSYLNVAFSNPGFPPWHYAYVEYMRRFKNCPVLARVNYGNTAGPTGTQFEVDAYPKFRKGTYAYLNAGYSSSHEVFPAYRAGAELYQKLPRGFEISAGARYMGFTTEDVFIYTAYLGKYYKNFWFAYRPFVVTKGSDAFVSHTGIIRWYFSDPDNYISLNLIYGATPYTTSSFADISKVNSQRIGMDLQYKITKRFLIKPMFSYEYEEYFPGLFRDRFYSQLILTKRF